MLYSNTTNFINPSTFILMGIPGQEEYHVWLSILFFTVYTIALLGNLSILVIVKMELSLHIPVYYFLCMLAFTDLVLCTSIVPKMLSIFWFNSSEIDFSACFTQMYFTICFSEIESGILVAMAFDRYWPYCQTNLIPHTYCEHLTVVKLACADIRISNYYGLFALCLVAGPDVFFITLSYTQILRTIVSLPTKDAWLKTFGTCSSHFCAMLAFYIPALFSFLTHRFGQNVPLHVHVLLANVYLLVAPMLNPIIYGAMMSVNTVLLQRVFHIVDLDLVMAAFTALLPRGS
ncbi:olfactory receptor 52E2-like [Carettochelys insculpta]|uniref:olfactory receptor 52E2-like n=1 Tax=Carettochelys insculpta TaxID=44489 RepID=UPI003EC0F0F7